MHLMPPASLPQSLASEAASEARAAQKARVTVSAAARCSCMRYAMVFSRPVCKLGCTEVHRHSFCTFALPQKEGAPGEEGGCGCCPCTIQETDWMQSVQPDYLQAERLEKKVETAEERAQRALQVRQTRQSMAGVNSL